MYLWLTSKASTLKHPSRPFWVITIGIGIVIVTNFHLIGLWCWPDHCLGQQLVLAEGTDSAALSIWTIDGGVGSNRITIAFSIGSWSLWLVVGVVWMQCSSFWAPSGMSLLSSWDLGGVLCNGLDRPLISPSAIPFKLSLFWSENERLETNVYIWWQSRFSSPLLIMQADITVVTFSILYNIIRNTGVCNLIWTWTIKVW